MGAILRLGVVAATLWAAAVLTAAGAWAGDLAEPVALECGGAVINVDAGHAAPFVCDWDGDGRQDLLVGQMGGGVLRIYRNTGSATAPAFESFGSFQAGGVEGSVPSG